jgi:bisphosphoglycerate-independent phosphoglycerate mutase (AlkP superfamily)
MCQACCKRIESAFKPENWILGCVQHYRHEDEDHIRDLMDNTAVFAADNHLQELNHQFQNQDEKSVFVDVCSFLFGCQDVATEDECQQDME